jgi:hypothetical protein
MAESWKCNGCHESYSDEDGADDFAEQFFCNECDSEQVDPYCCDCVLYFEKADIAICQRCLDKALSASENITGKVVEKTIYVAPTTSNSSETMEEFEERVMKE